MKGVYPGESRYILEPFCIEEGEAEFFDLGKIRFTGKASALEGEE